MESIEALYRFNVGRAHDINEHLPTLRELAATCPRVVELGFRTGRSTSAFLAGGAESVTVYDVHPCADHRAEFERLAPGRFTFHLGDSRTVEIEEHDLLFIDSYHSGAQLRAELNKHEAKVKELIVMHDTVTFGEKGEDGKQGLWPVITQFCVDYEWTMVEHYKNNNGLTVLGRR